MYAKEIIVEKDCFIYKQEVYSWTDIVGIRTHLTPNRRNIWSPPLVEILLNDERILNIGKSTQFEFIFELLAINTNDLNRFLSTIKQKNHDYKDIILTPREWRIILSVGFSELIVFYPFFITLQSEDFSKADCWMVLSVIAGISIGYIWDMMCRRYKMRKRKKKLMSSAEPIRQK